jgi:hypothetical protein
MPPTSGRSTILSSPVTRPPVAIYPPTIRPFTIDLFSFYPNTQGTVATEKSIHQGYLEVALFRSGEGGGVCPRKFSQKL